MGSYITLLAMSPAQDHQVTRLTRLSVRLLKIITVLWLPVIFLILSGNFSLSSPVETSPAVLTTLTHCLVLSLLVFLLGEVTGNVSSVDRLWSLLPFLYTVL